jgi:hypothetical protein
MPNQQTLGGEPVIDEADLRQRLEDHGWSLGELADHFDVSEQSVERAMNAYGIDYNSKATAASTSGSAKKLWQMDADDFDAASGGESA